MNSHRILPIIALALVTSMAPAAIDLTPRATHYEVEGLKFPCVAFKNGSREISYTPPEGWRLSGGGNRLTLSPKQPTQADASIEVLPPLAPGTILTPEALLKLACAALPRGAEKVEHLGNTENPLRIDGNGTVEVALRYQQAGLGYRTNVILMMRGSDLWRFAMSARNQDFDKVSTPFRSSLYSLQGLAEMAPATSTAKR